MVRQHQPRELRGEEQRSAPSSRPPGPAGLRPPGSGTGLRRRAMSVGPAGCSLPALPAVAKPNCERFRMRSLGWLRCAFSEPPLVAAVSRSQHPAVLAWLCSVKVLRISLSWQTAEHGFHSEWKGCPSSSGCFAVSSCQTEDLPQIVH